MKLTDLGTYRYTSSVDGSSVRRAGHGLPIQQLCKKLGMTRQNLMLHFRIAFCGITENNHRAVAVGKLEFTVVTFTSIEGRFYVTFTLEEVKE